MKELTLKQIQSNPDFFYSKDFWIDSDLIEKYCNSIMSDHGFNTKVIIAFDEVNAFVTKDHVNNYHKIRIPTVNFKDKTEEEIQEQILHRSVFLRHELSHILYSDFDVIKAENAHKVKSKFLLNCLEDVRIEKKFAAKYRGSADAFTKLHTYYHAKNGGLLESGKLNLNHLGLYFISRSYGFSFTQNEVTSVYEKIYQKNKFFYNLEFKELLELSNSIAEEFKKLLPKPSLQEIIEKSKVFDEALKMPHDKAKKLIDVLNESKKNLEEKLNAGEDEGDDGLSSEDSEDVEISQQDETPTLKQEASSGKQASPPPAQDKDEKPVEFSDFIKQEIKEQKENESNEESKEITKDLEDVKKDLEDFHDDGFGSSKESQAKNTLEKKLAEISDKLSKIKDKVNNEINVDHYFKSAFKSGIIFPYDEIVAAFPHNIKQELSGIRGVTKQDKQYSPVAIYKSVVQKNNAVIQDAVSYLKLKFQGREKTKNINNKEEGLLDSYNLSKIFANDNNVFYKKFETIVEKSNVILLLDYSGSMSSNIREALQSIIVFHEILKRIDMPHAIYVFTNPMQFRFLPWEPSEKDLSIARNIFKKYSLEEFFDSQHHGGFSGGSAFGYKYGDERIGEFDNSSCSYQIRSINEKSKDLTEKILGFLYSKGSNSPIEMHGTPEPNCVYSLYKKFNHLKNKKFIFVNDGCYGSYSNNEALHAAIGDRKKEGVSSDVTRLFDTTIDELLYKISYKKRINLKLNEQTRIAINKAFVSKINITTQYYLGYIEQRVASYKYRVEKSLRTRKSKNTLKLLKKRFDEDNYLKIIKKLQIAFLEFKNKLENSEKTISEKSFTFNVPGIVYSSKVLNDGGVEFVCEISNSVLKILGQLEYDILKKSDIVGNMYTNLADDPNNIGAFINSLDGHWRGYSKETKSSVSINLIERTMDATKDRIKRSAETDFDDSNSIGINFNDFYLRLFKEMRQQGWYVCGFGIRSASGVEYLGPKYFQVLESAADISSNFSKKLRKII